MFKDLKFCQCFLTEAVTNELEFKIIASRDKIHA